MLKNINIPEIVNVTASLACLMCANILMGKKIADFKEEYDKKKLTNGISKAIFMLISLALIYASTMLYNVKVATINGEQVSTLDGATILIKGALVVYGYKDLVKLKDLLMVTTTTVFEIGGEEDLSKKESVLSEIEYEVED